MGTPKPTIKDIAEIAGVSLPTVHKAIYGKPGISEATRKRILDITEELHYVINPTASRLKRGVINLAIVLPMLSRQYDQFFRKMWEGVERCEKNMADYNAVLIRFPCGRTSESQFPIFEELLTREDIHGVITYCWDDKALNPYFERLKQKGIPVVTVDSDAVDSCRIGCVRASGRQTGQLAAELLSKMIPYPGRLIFLNGNVQQALLQLHHGKSSGFGCPGNRQRLRRHVPGGYACAGDKESSGHRGHLLQQRLQCPQHVPGPGAYGLSWKDHRCGQRHI